MTKESRLKALKEEIVKTKVCPKLASEATNLVFGAGNPDSQIIFIGEAPGKNEDIKGLPFVGAAGKFLDDMLSRINLERDSVYITNIVKYRPPNNRDPLPEEKKEFLPFLKRQIEIIRPKIVVTLGRHSLNCFIPDAQISKIHGKVLKIKLVLGKAQNDQLEILLVPLFHPAAALYNGSMRKTLIDDFNNLPIILKNLSKGIDNE